MSLKKVVGKMLLYAPQLSAAVFAVAGSGVLVICWQLAPHLSYVWLSIWVLMTMLISYLMHKNAQARERMLLVIHEEFADAFKKGEYSLLKADLNKLLGNTKFKDNQ